MAIIGAATYSLAPPFSYRKYPMLPHPSGSSIIVCHVCTRHISRWYTTCTILYTPGIYTYVPKHTKKKIHKKKQFHHPPPPPPCPEMVGTCALVVVVTLLKRLWPVWSLASGGRCRTFCLTAKTRTTPPLPFGSYQNICANAAPPPPKLNKVKTRIFRWVM